MGNLKMREVRLNNGVVMPSIGFGVYQIPKNDTKRCVLDALEVGYRMIDTAASYFNEKEVGEAVRESGLPRESVFVTSKLWVQDYEYDDALKAAEKSLDELGLEYIDLYLLHKPYGNYYSAWRALESLYEQGRIRAIGVTSFSDERLQDLYLHNKIKPAVNQIETHPFRQQQKSNAFLKAEGIVHETWAPFAEGQRGIFSNPVLAKIAAAHGKSIAAVILRWLNQRSVVVIPKSAKRERMVDNFNIFDFALSTAEMQEIAALNEEKSPIYDEADLATVRAIGLHTIHE